MGWHNYIRSVRAGARRSVAFYSSANKPYRERWVVRSFLRNFGVKFHAFQVQSERNEPPDVRYFTAAFEIKEIMDPGRRRHDEYRVFLKRANSASSPNDLLEFHDPRDISLSEVLDLLWRVAEELGKKYPVATRKSLDLLAYVNLKHVLGIKEDVVPVTQSWRRFGFRSISFLKGSQTSYVAFADHTAPSFLHGRVGELVHFDHAT